MSKYGAKKVVVDDITFDSKMESEYYLYLKDKKDNGEIKDFELQPQFELLPKFQKHGKTYRAMMYKADFKIEYLDGKVEIIDVKGFTTSDFKLKEKLYNYKYEYPLLLITYSKKWGGWIELDELARLRKEAKKSKRK